MTVSRLRDIPGIGVDKVGDAADAAADPQFVRLENLDTDLRPPEVALGATRAAIDRDDANSYLPFQGHLALREAACVHVTAATGRRYDPGTRCVSVACRDSTRPPKVRLRASYSAGGIFHRCQERR
jgi:aspartate/methionine/tyrosine aminotransferase